MGMTGQEKDRIEEVNNKRRTGQDRRKTGCDRKRAGLPTRAAGAVNITNGEGFECFVCAPWTWTGDGTMHGMCW